MTPFLYMIFAILEFLSIIKNNYNFNEILLRTNMALPLSSLHVIFASLGFLSVFEKHFASKNIIA
jgi:uncharacterized protein YjfI (DUF2170 family)